MMPPSSAALAALALAVLAPGAAAQAAGNAPASASGDFRQEFLRDFGTAANKLVSLAEAVPEDAYGWRPMQGVASPAEVFRHVARYNYYYPATSLDVSAPDGVEWERFEEDVPGKAEVVASLRESMEHVRGVVQAMGAGDVDAPARLYGRDVTRRAVLLQLLTHMHEHLGQSIAYARMNGVVPPWSR